MKNYFRSRGHGSIRRQKIVIVPAWKFPHWNEGLLTKTQVQEFFSSLPAARRRQGSREIEVEGIYAEEEEQERHEMLENVAGQLGLKNPICYDSHCLCDLSRDKKLETFSQCCTHIFSRETTSFPSLEYRRIDEYFGQRIRSQTSFPYWRSEKSYRMTAIPIRFPTSLTADKMKLLW